MVEVKLYCGISFCYAKMNIKHTWPTQLHLHSVMAVANLIVLLVMAAIASPLSSYMNASENDR